MPVEIDLSGSDIPGLPNKMEVKNAAEEATLQELLDLFKKTNKVEEAQLKALNKLANIKEKKSKEDKPDPKKESAGKKEIQSTLNAAKANAQNATVGQRLGRSMGSMAQSAGVVTKGITVFGGAAARAAKEVLEITAAASQMVGEFARMQDNLTAATSSLRRIPFFGTALASALGPAAEAAERSYAEYTKLANSGANFGGSMQDMITAATGAGLTMEQFNLIVTQNGQAMMALGGTTEQGAKRFAQMGKEMRQSQIGTELLRLGFTTQEVNGGMASYLNIVRGTGKMQNYSTSQLAESSGRYLKDLQQLAKITGQSVEEKKKEAEALAKDVQFRAAMQKLAPEEQAQMMNMINSYPEAHRTAIKDMLATGSITTEEGRKFQALYPEAAGNFRNANKTIRQGQAISKSAQEQMRNSYIDESKSTMERNKQLLTYSREFDGVGAGIIEAQGMQKDAYKNAAAEQDKIAKQGGATAEQIAKFKQRVAQTSNEMTKGLISTSALAAMETAFMGLANFTQQFVVPALRVMFDVIGYVVDIVGSVLSPIFATLGFVVDAIAEGLDVLKPIIDIVMDAFSVVGKVLGTVLVPVIIGVGAILAVAFAPVIAKIALVVGVIGLLNKAFSGIGDTVKDVADGFMDAIDAVRSYLPSFLGGLSKDEAAERKASRESGRQEREERRKSADAIKKETDAKKTTSTDKGMDWSGPAAMLKSYGEATGSVYAKNAEAEEKRIQKEKDLKKKAEMDQQESQQKIQSLQQSGSVYATNADMERQKRLLTYSREVNGAEEKRIQKEKDLKKKAEMDQQESQQKIQSLQQSIAKDKEKLEGTENARLRKAIQNRIDAKQKEIDDELKRKQKSTAKIRSEENSVYVTNADIERNKRMLTYSREVNGAEEKRIQKEKDLKKKAEMDQQVSQQKIQSLQQSIAKDKEKLEGTENARLRKAIQNRIDAKQKEIDDELKRKQKSTAKIRSEEKSAADEKIKYTINGKEVTKEEYEEQKKAMGELTGKMRGTVGSMFSQPFVAKGGGGGGAGGAKAAGGAAGGGGGGGGGGGAGGGAGGGGGGGAGIGAVSGGGKLPTVGDKQGKASPGDEEMVGDVGQFLKTPSGADLGGLESGTKKRLSGLAQEYFNATGEKIQINTAFRSYEDQMALFKKYGSPRAARPGRSKHEVGLAFDMQSAHANKAIQLGLFDKYGFHRPVSGETWHIEPVEARGGVPDNPVAPGQEVMVSNAGKAVTPDSGKPQAEKGGILSGPKSGFDATLHGTEAVVPLPDGKRIPVEISGLSTDSLISTIAELTAKLEFLVGGNLVDVEQNFSGSFLAEITKMVDKIGMATTEAHNRGVDFASALHIKPIQTLDELSKNMLATGGITSGASIAGEAGPEAVVPLPDGRTIPVTIVGGGDQNAMVDLLTALNTKMDQLVFINSMLADIGNNQLKVQKNIGHPDLLVG